MFNKFITMLTWVALILFFAPPSNAAEEGKSRTFVQGDQVIVAKEISQFPMPQGVPLECVRDAIGKGIAECTIPSHQDRIHAWFALPIQMAHPMATLTFSESAGFSVQRGETVYGALFFTAVLFMVAVVPLSIGFGILFEEGRRFDEPSAQRIRFCWSLVALYFLIVIFAGLGALLGRTDALPIVVLAFGGAFLLRAIAGLAGPRGSESKLLDVCVFFLTLLVFVFSGGCASRGWENARMTEYLALIGMVCLGAYLLFEGVLFYRKWRVARTA